MNLKKIPSEIAVYGDTAFRGDCDKEIFDQINFFSYLKLNHAGLYVLAFHPKNEGKRKFGQVSFDKKSGALNAGVSDIIIPSMPAFVCEVKRKNHLKSKLPDNEIKYLVEAHKNGCFACIALGYVGILAAFEDWLKIKR